MCLSGHAIGIGGEKSVSVKDVGKSRVLWHLLSCSFTEHTCLERPSHNPALSPQDPTSPFIHNCPRCGAPVVTCPCGETADFDCNCFPPDPRYCGCNSELPPAAAQITFFMVPTVAKGEVSSAPVLPARLFRLEPQPSVAFTGNPHPDTPKDRFAVLRCPPRVEPGRARAAALEGHLCQW